MPLTRRMLAALILAAQVGCSSDSGEPSSVFANRTVGKDKVEERTQAPFDVVGVVGTGQSLSVGTGALPVLSTKQPFGNLKLDVPVDGGPSQGLLPLVEPIRSASGNEYPKNIYGETPHTAMSIQLSALFQERTGNGYTTVHSVVGEGGQGLSVIGKEGPRSYAGALDEARKISGLLGKQGKTFGYGAVVLTHGESDAGNPDYEQDLVALQASYQADLQAITGQTLPIVMLLTQQATFPASQSIPARSSVLAWTAALHHPEEIVCAGPKYQYEYASDLVHLTARSEVRLGVKYAQVYNWVLNRRKSWKPVQPRSVKLEAGGAAVTLEFDVMFPPLQWDQTLSPPHQTAHPEWRNGKGFEVTDALGEVPIQDVALLGPDAVRIELGRPLKQPAEVSHAIYQDVESHAGGTAYGYRGLLVDSDPFVGVDAEEVECIVESGSPYVTAAPGAEAALASRGLREVVLLAGGKRSVVTGKAAYLTLSAPWEGTGGKQKLVFASDQRNYLVQFSLPIP